MILLHDLIDEAFELDFVDEPLVDVSVSSSIQVDMSRSQIANRSRHFCFVRSTVFRMLEVASASLPLGYRLVLKEGYRPCTQQKRSYERVLEAISRKYPDLPISECHKITSEYVAPIQVAGHPTGGAVDVTLSFNGSELNLGTTFNAEPDETGNRTYTNSADITRAERTERTILVNAMTTSGFINYPTEWWHWSFGDKYWAKISTSKVRYDVIDLAD